MAQPGKYTGWIDYVCRDRTVNLYARMPDPYPRIKPYYFDSSQDDQCGLPYAIWLRAEYSAVTNEDYWRVLSARSHITIQR